MIISGIAWTDITRMVKEEKKQNNPLANLIFKLHLDKSYVTLLLDALNEDEDEMSSTSYALDEKFTNWDPVTTVDVDLNITAQMNIQKYFEIKKKSHEKELKTRAAADVAIKDAETHATRELNKVRKA